MCGRYSFAKDLSELAQLVEFVARIGFFAPRYNIAPRQQVPVLVQEKGRTEARLLRWGLVPSWAKDESIGDKLINARSETLLEKPSFRKPLMSRRCLIPADGFYEWKREAKRNTPFRFTLKGGGLFCFAGLWECWIRPPRAGEFQFDYDGDEPPPSQVMETFTIITVAANEMMRPVHDRMPAILHPGHYRWWLDEFGRGDELTGLLRPYNSEEMECVRVSPLVNNAKNDSPECIQPA